MLADRLQEVWSVERLAAVLGLRGRTLQRFVRRELGISPMRLLRRVRLRRARSHELDRSHRVAQPISPAA